MTGICGDGRGVCGDWRGVFGDVRGPVLTGGGLR